MDGLKKHIFIFFVLGMLAIPIVAFRGFLITNIIEPVAYLFWAVWRMVSSVNQNIYWAILVVACSILMTRLVVIGGKNAKTPADTYAYKTPTRTEYWKTLISDFMHGNGRDEYLRGNLKKLLASVIAQTERFDPPDLDEAILAGLIPLSLRASYILVPPKERNITRWLNFIYLPRKWFQRWSGRQIRQDTVLISEILEWMETEMEINKNG